MPGRKRLSPRDIIAVAGQRKMPRHISAISRFAKERNIVKRIFLGHSLFALVVFALVASPLGQVFSRQAAAQSAEPVVVISIAGPDELLRDILY